MALHEHSPPLLGARLLIDRAERDDEVPSLVELDFGDRPFGAVALELVANPGIVVRDPKLDIAARIPDGDQLDRHVPFLSAPPGAMARARSSQGGGRSASCPLRVARSWV